MTWSNRFRLVAGLLAVVLVCAALTLVMNRRLAQATSESATIRAESLGIGTDYAGTVSEALVEDGDEVAAGDPLFTVSSLTLQHDLALGLVSTDTAAYQVDDDGTITLVAPYDAVVTEVAARQGAFVEAGSTIATLDRAGSLTVDAQVELDPSDFARVRTGAPVRILLPDRSELTGEVASVSVTDDEEENRVLATVEVTSDELADGANDGLVSSGTPVVASIDLHVDGPLAGVNETFGDFLRKVGL
ncbi:HlyD family efflux transporter periplasmic adaptor subunit [Cellulosimicrobium arenosum]|uniref:Biotin/lipoyl-binding protein n=1 Tax=Cellulosimicrobium arenosum TaxID=2708133 RepID=A0A927J0L6_9MICO|nr:HlyD family efflux transporter periplasmic adaptor subunit [Cellulosimicrobium arenosum]MBD8079704.1 biotin/lipoyl-binding protein [Cellulosimicrobium arenosum]